MWKTHKTPLMTIFKEANALVHNEIMRMKRMKKTQRHHLRSNIIYINLIKRAFWNYEKAPLGITALYL